MDGTGFDQLTRRFATRRTALAALGGLAALGLGGRRGADAKGSCKAPKAVCSTGKNRICCASGECVGAACVTCWWLDFEQSWIKADGTDPAFSGTRTATTRAACQALDGCDPSGGSPGSGCYKWAASANTQLAPPW
jgi:hypothetical protein